MRQIYLDNIEPDNEIYKLSFYSPSEGYVGFRDWVGYTTDSGRTFTKKYITLGNVNFNGYPVNLTFGFSINGVKAFNQNTIVVYGHYALVPAILYSSNGGNNYTLVYHSQFNPFQLNGGITDMIFPQNNSTGFAVDFDRILKTIDGGLNWTVSRTDAGSDFTYLEGVDNNVVFALATYSQNKLLKTINGGSSWQPVSFPFIPNGRMTYAHFLNSNTGWLGMRDDNNKEYFYKTTNGGSNWTLQNNIIATPFACGKMKFIDNNTGYALYTQNTVWKTTNSGVTWEPLPRDNNFFYLGFSHNDLQCWSATQLWAGGGHGLLELSTNGGGTPLPQAYFLIDTIGVGATGNVNLVNYSMTGYNYQWVVNGTPLSSSYNAGYAHDVNRTRDTIKLIVSNGIAFDTTIQYQDFYPPVIVSSFTPTSAGIGNQVMITGLNFTGATSVTFGGVNANSFSVLSSTSIRAFVGTGASGVVKVVTATGQGSLGGFIFIPPPVISSFDPTTAAAGATVTITGSNFTGATNVSFGGVPAFTFNVVSSTTIIVLVPSGGSGSVSVTTPGGTATLAGFVSLPTITSFTPLNGTYGTVLNISGTSFTGTTAVTVGGINALSFTINSSTSITAIVGNGATGSVTVTKPGGSSTLAGFTWFPPPTITSFAPASGPVGTTVTITGTNFHANPTNNIVYFGTVKATVSSGTANSLTVTVPIGATFQPVSVTSNNLTAYSKQPFLVTFPNGGSITQNSFPVRTEVPVGTGYTPHDLQLGDIDGDGKLDLALVTFGPFVIDNGVSIMRNTSTISTVSFEPKIDFKIREPKTIALGDLDGDGKLDFAVTNDDLPGSLNIGVFRNMSAIGNISFASPLIVPTLGRPVGIVITDIDSDGKPDIAITTTNGLSVYRNIGEPGLLAFAPRVTFAFGNQNLTSADLDGDGKPDMIASSWNDDYVNVLRNTSTKGNVSFASNFTIPADAPYYVSAGDIDGDGKPDIVTTNITASKATIYRNTGSLGNTSFADAIEFEVEYSPSGLALNDLDGDGKLDLAVGAADHLFSALKNISQSGSISLAPRVNYVAGQFIGDNTTAIGDINGDGKPDPAIVREVGGSVSIFINDVKPEPFIASFSPTVGASGTVVTITGNNFTNVTEVSFGGIPASSFTVNSSTDITATVGAGASGNVSVTNNYGTGVHPGFSFGLPPVITSFSPGTGALGSAVTINGSYFNPDINSNTVYFGGVKASVSSATATTLTVAAPPGISPKPISVTSNALTGYSARPFMITYPGAGPVFYPGSFAPRFDRSNGGSCKVGDIDGDGKPDLVMSRANGISIGRNTSTVDNLSFASNVDFPTSTGSSRNSIADFDGDGKLDVAGFNFDVNSISVLRNTSSPGSVSFAPKFDYSLGFDTRPQDITTGDLDLDGRPDIIVANYYVHTISVFRNLSTPGYLLFDTRIDFFVDGYPTGVSVGDLDGDGKPEIAASVNGSDVSSVFRNTSIVGTISFAAKIDFTVAAWPTHVQFGDLDGDGKMEMVVANGNSFSMSVFRNTSSAGNISFAPRNDFSTGELPSYIQIADLDGDGKPELTTYDRSSHNIAVFKNICTTGNIAFNSKVDYAMGGDPYTGDTGDMDGDGKLDIVTHQIGGTNSILRNLVGGATVSVAVCANSTTTLTSNITGTTYQWQQDTGTGWNNIADNSNFSGTATVNLQITNIPSSWNGYKYRCTVNGSLYSNTYTLAVTGTVTPSVTIFASNIIICPGTTVNFSATPVNGGTPSYQWQVNGVNVGTNSPSYSSNSLANLAQVKVIMASNATCASPTTATSNTIIIFHDFVVPEITISGTTTVNAGTQVLFSSYVVNGGSVPTYQWQDSTSFHTWQNIIGANSASLNYTPMLTGDRIRCVLTSNATCATPATVLSNVLVFTVNAAITVSVCANSSTTLTSNITGTTYQWQQNTGTGWTNLTNNTNFAGVNTVNLQINNIPASWNGYQYRCYVNGSQYSNIFTLAVSTTPVTPAVNITPSPGSTVCSGTNVTFTATPTNGGTAPSYQWKRNGNNVGTNSNTYSNNALVTGDMITVTMTSTAACASPVTVTSAGITMTVGSTITPTVNIAANPGNTICTGTNVTFTATWTNGGTPSFQWKLNGNNVGINGFSYSNNALANGDTISVEMHSSIACASPGTVASNIIIMTVGSSVTPSVSITANPGNTICAGLNVTFTATPTNGGTTPSYQWKRNGNNVGTSSNTYSNNSLANGDVITVVMTSSISCASPTTATSTGITMIVGSTVVPSVSITANPGNTICAGANVTFTATPTNGGTPTYQWKLNGNNVGANSNTYSNNALANGNVVTVVMTSSIACASPTTATATGITMTVTSVTPAITINGTTTVTTGTPVVLSSTIANGGSSPAYQWQDSTSVHTWQNISGGNAAGLTYTPALTGDRVRCVLTGNANCSTANTATSNVLVFTVTPVTAVNPVPATRYGIKAYPNPATNLLTIDSLKLFDQWHTLEITSMDGRQKIIFKKINGQTRVSLNVEKLAAGYYVVILTRKQGLKAYLTFIKQ